MSVRPGAPLEGCRFELEPADARYPAIFRQLARPPKKLYVIGSLEALEEGIAVVGARKATPYGRGCAERFARIAAEHGVNVISGGARGCDAAAHRAALDANGRTAVFLGGGCDELYPAEHAALFQEVIDAGGAVVSEHPWEQTPRPYMFRDRNRLIAALGRAVLVVEAGLPSGTFSTADEALAMGREVLAVPGAITSHTSRGANRLIYQGAIPIVDDDAFDDAMTALFPRRWALKRGRVVQPALLSENDPVSAALATGPLTLDELFELARRHCGDERPRDWLFERLTEGEIAGRFKRQPDGRYGPVVKRRA